MRRKIAISCVAVLVAVAQGLAEDGAAAHWAFRAPVRPAPPRVRDEARVVDSIDRFIVARLEERGLGLSPEADRATLIRRLSLDLRGLPPTRAEVRAFLADEHPLAYERLVDRMLASPHYGERQARHWLDLARYADSNGYTRDFRRSIWRYRDWLIAAFNRGMPFDQFIIEQLAGDLLPDATLDQRIATGFHRNTLFNEEGGTDPEQFRIDAVADRVDTTGTVLLGLTLGCSRCHDHKFDPIAQKEYYELFAFLNDCDELTIDAPTPVQSRRGELAERDRLRARVAALNKELEETKRAELLEKQLAWEATLTPADRARYPGQIQEALQTKPEERSETYRKLAREAYKDSAIARQDFAEIAEIHRLRASEPPIPTTLVLQRRETPRETFVHIRGDFLSPGERVEPGVPRVLHPLPEGSRPRTRLDLARWIVSPENPLTPRVVMNRAWMCFFGRGLVETENDFGLQGTPPSHPELLDWLAVELVARGWDLRSMHRSIVMSATYRQSSRERPELTEIDPSDRLLARQSRLRVEAEIIRDSALVAGGVLCAEIGGPGVFPPQPDGVFDFTQDKKDWIAETGSQRFRRGMYTFLWRSSLHPSLVVFDFPNSNVTCTRRARTNTPLQALTLANDVAFVECARALGRLVAENGETSDEARIAIVVESCLARSPAREETELLAEFLRSQRAGFRDDPAAAAKLAATEGAGAAEIAAWTAVARAVMNTDEFIVRE